MVPTWLVCTAGPQHGRRVQVPESGLTIGRAEDNGLVIPDEGVSRYHVRLIWQNGSLWVQDAGSRNGTFVNDVRVAGHLALKPGDVITVSHHAFDVRLLDEAPGPPVTAPPASERANAPTAPPPRPRRRWFWPF